MNHGPALTGNVFGIEGPDHSRQRKILNPAFTYAQIRGLMPVFYGKAAEVLVIFGCRIDPCRLTVTK